MEARTEQTSRCAVALQQRVSLCCDLPLGSIRLASRMGNAVCALLTAPEETDGTRGLGLGGDEGTPEEGSRLAVPGVQRRIEHHGKHRNAASPLRWH